MQPKPKRWQDIPWDQFPTEITWRGLTLTPASFLSAFFDDHLDPILIQPYFDQLIGRFHWDYLDDPQDWLGKPISMGLYYGYPRCCIYEFAFGRYADRHPMAYANLEHGGWILCHTCAETVAQQGIEAYLENQAWER